PIEKYDSIIAYSSVDTTYTDNNVTNYTFYYYQLSSVDTLGNESQLTDTIRAIPCEIISDYDGNEYRTIKIGEQYWMRDNVATTHYSDGSTLINGAGAGTITDYSAQYYFAYNNDENNVATYGRLYTWAAIMKGESLVDNPDYVQGICSDEWHIPSDSEWKQLEIELGMSQAEADAMDWRGTNEGSLIAGRSDLWNDDVLEMDPDFGNSGFFALPTGFRYSSGSFSYLNSATLFWSKSHYNTTSVWTRRLDNSLKQIRRDDESKIHAFPIRCIKNTNPIINSARVESSHWGNDDGSEDYGVIIEIQVNDPQGLTDIESVIVNYPNGQTHELYDNGQNGDSNPNDGWYSYHDWSFYGASPLGVYTFTVTDYSGNTVVQTDTLNNLLDFPRNLNPKRNAVVTTSTPTLSWDTVPDAVTYSVRVYDKYGNHIWESGDIGTNSVVYNFNATGSALVDGELYRWSLNANFDDAQSSYNNNDDIKFFYSTDTDNPVAIFQQVCSRHYGDDLGNEEFGHTFDIEIGDPQGLDDIESVIVTSPENEVITLYDDGQHSDHYANDGHFAHHINGLIEAPPTGDYTFTITDLSGNSSTPTDNLSLVLDFPRHLSPGMNEVVNVPNPELKWDPVENADNYNVYVKNSDDSHVWGWYSTNDTSVVHNVDFSGSDLVDGEIYFLHVNIGKDDAESWHNELRFAYSTIIDFPIIDNYNLSIYNNNYNNAYNLLSLCVWADILDPQGLSDIDSVWVVLPDESYVLLYDDGGHWDNNSNDGRYENCQERTSFPNGDYLVNVVDYSGNKISKTITIDYQLDCPQVISFNSMAIIAEPDFNIDWEPVDSVVSYSVTVFDSNWQGVWSYTVDSSITSLNYNENNSGQNLIEGKIYTLQVYAQDNKYCRSQTQIKFAFANQGLIAIDGNKDSFWETATGHIYVGTENLVYGIIDDENDCSADVYLAYDSNFLYGLIEVTDDIMGDKYDWWWDNDAFKLIFDTDPFSLATEQNADDRFNIEYTARSDADDQRNGREPCLYKRTETVNGYAIEFAISKDALINTSPEPDEQIMLQEGKQYGFLFKMADEDDLDNQAGREAEFAWGHISINQNSENNVAQYGSLTFLADNQIQLSHDNLVMDENAPYIISQNINLQHYNNYANIESWGYQFSLNLNDPQGLDDIDSVWVTCPNGNYFVLYDGTQCGDDPN
ncbi:MAG TPA: FISUMP domain-containing protein, partial [Saprospiraceae bacterium]|nr:FISUMP domain-containing protein [Saprospiraceae bacterium]